MNKYGKKTLAEQLSDKYEVDPTTGCWNWKGCKGKTGYGKMGKWENGRPRFYAAHRASYIVHKGEIPGGAYILHKCDNRGCINPEHLYPGDQRDNMRDMISKGRQYWANLAHCPRGHEYLGDNLRLIGRKKVCRACAKIANDKHKSKPKV